MTVAVKRLLLLIVGLVACVAPARALVCRDREDQAALAEAICVLDRACRFEIIDNPRISGSGASWQARLRERLAATPSMRARFAPPAWLNDTALEWSTDAATGTNCTAIADAVANDAAAPPAAALLFVAAWVHFENYLAQDAHCDDLNEIATPAPDGTLVCLCLPGKHCRLAGLSVTDALLIITSIVTLIVLAAVLVASVMSVRRVRVSKV